MAKVSYAADGLALLAGGSGAADTVAGLTSLRTRVATTVSSAWSAPRSQSTFTGPGCMDWAGGVTGGDADSGYAIQGNILVGERVVLEMERAWLEHPQLPLAPQADAGAGGR